MLSKIEKDKTPRLKITPSLRDHTTSILTPEWDEYIPREFDEAGERKVNPQGHLMGNRGYRMRTFYVPSQGDKLFMLATECARVLNYRDPYSLFYKNHSLFKIIVDQAEKDDLIHQEILPYSYRSRQIAIVTAKSIFRQFGARAIINGQPVKDDYWEAKARNRRITEDDLAGKKGPGGSKAWAWMEAQHLQGRPETIDTSQTFDSASDSYQVKAQKQDSTKNDLAEAKQPGAGQAGGDLRTKNASISLDPDTGVSNPTEFQPRSIRADFNPEGGPMQSFVHESIRQNMIDSELFEPQQGLTKAGKPWKRLAVACTTCREKKVKCDPATPKCLQCKMFGRNCRYPNSDHFNSEKNPGNDSSVEKSSSRTS